ncbi:MAG: aminotransferase class V-fold PLP-dependent enzyme [Verrucomicrobiota bacterium]
MKISEIIKNESLRQELFPIVRNQVFFGHAGVCPLSGPAIKALKDFGERSHLQHQEAGGMMEKMDEVRLSCAQLIGAKSEEIALLGPTALGLSLVANGFPWKEGDEVIFHGDDYPANVYPWLRLKDIGVKAISILPERPGEVTWELIEPHLTERTRMVALASAHYLTGYRIDVERIGKELHQREIRFCLDAIQTLGSIPTDVRYVDYLSADSHKWLLGPMGAGIFYVKESRFNEIKPTLLGSWNVFSPEFIAQEKIDFYPGARRYEPGSLNLPGNLAMQASIQLLLDIGISEVRDRLFELRRYIQSKLEDLGLEPYPVLWTEENAAGMMALRLQNVDLPKLGSQLTESNLIASYRENRSGEVFMRLSPHFYNTESEVDRFFAKISILLNG